MAGYEDRGPSGTEKAKIGGFGTLAVIALASLVVLVALTWTLDQVSSDVTVTEAVPLNAPAEEGGLEELTE